MFEKFEKDKIFSNFLKIIKCFENLSEIYLRWSPMRKQSIGKRLWYHLHQSQAENTNISIIFLFELKGI